MRKHLHREGGANMTELQLKELLADMSLGEKIEQLIQFHGGFYGDVKLITGPGHDYTIKPDQQWRIGTVLGEAGYEHLKNLQDGFMEKQPHHIPTIFMSDVIHGYKTIFPVPLGQGAGFDPELTRELAEATAKEASAAGLHVTFSPMCDLSRDARWGRCMEGTGEDPWLNARFAEAMVLGYQGDGIEKQGNIAACVKHFAAYGAPEAGRDYNTVDMSERMFRDRYLPPYVAALKAGAATAMTSFNDYEAIPASGNRWLLKELLRDELGFEGFVVSDYRAITEMIDHGVAADDKEAAALALKAWLDMEMVSGSYLNHAEALIEEGVISEKDIDRMCRNILVAKYNLGLFEDPFRYGGAERFTKAIYKKETRDFARKVAQESMVLLKNEGSVLPLDSGEKIALIGPFVSSQRAMLGSWTALRDYDSTAVIKEGFNNRFPGRVTVTEGCAPFGDIDGGIAQAVRAARNADVAVLTLGFPGELSGEATSMASVELPECQKKLLAAVKATGKPVVVLLTTGRPMALESVIDDMDALLVVWHPGTEGGHAIADVVSGDVSPSGHLTMCFPRCDGQIPIRYNHKNTGRPLTKAHPNPEKPWAKYYKSCYLNTPNTPLYPFGYGLSYTTFEFDSLTVVNPQVAMGKDVVIKARVRNVGDRDGATVAQLYMRDLVASTTRPVRELKGFERIELKSGESAELEFVLTAEDMAFCREDMKFAQEPGDFKVWVGQDSDATLEAQFTVLP